MDNLGHLTDHLPTSSCPRSLWTTPNSKPRSFSPRCKMLVSVPKRLWVLISLLEKEKKWHCNEINSKPALLFSFSYIFIRYCFDFHFKFITHFIIIPILCPKTTILSLLIIWRKDTGKNWRVFLFNFLFLNKSMYMSNKNTNSKRISTYYVRVLNSVKE